MRSAVVFDLDGTLVDSRPGIDWAVAEALAAVAPEVEPPAMGPHIGPPLPEMLRRALPGLADDRRAEVGVRYRELYDREGWARTVVYPGIPELLEWLVARGCPAHVVTNKPAAPTAAILGLPALAGLIATARSPDTVEPRHPDKPAMLDATLVAERLSPDRVLMVGDDDGDRRAAQSAGCAFLAVAYGFGDAARTLRPSDEGCAGGPADIGRIIAEWLAS